MGSTFICYYGKYYDFRRKIITVHKCRKGNIFENEINVKMYYKTILLQEADSILETDVSIPKNWYIYIYIYMIKF